MSKKIYTDLDLLGGATVTGLKAPSAASDAVRKTDLDAAIEGLKQKDPVRVATQSNTNLASPGATLDGVTLANGDRVLVRSQSTASQNGIYLFNGAAVAMTRSLDASTAAELNNAIVPVSEGTDAGKLFRQTATIATLGTDTVTFATFGTAASQATETAAGIAEIATQSETDTGTDDVRYVTPLKLATHAGRKRKHVAAFGDGSATQYDFSHNFSTRDVHVQVYRTGSPYDTIECDVSRLDTNTVRLNLVTAPTSNQFTVVILG